MTASTPCTCPDPWCPLHATCGACGGPVVILDEDDPAFCPACGRDVMPARACGRANPMTNRPRLYPGHRHQWDAPACATCGARLIPDSTAPGEWIHGTLTDHPATPGMVVCTVCDFQAPRNAAGLDGDMTGARARVAVFPQIENGIAYTAAGLDAALTAEDDPDYEWTAQLAAATDLDDEPEQETR